MLVAPVGIRVAGVSKQFGSFRAVDDVSLDVDTGSLVALLGPSGSGKSTLLRLIAGLEDTDDGRIWITGEEATSRSVQERQVGFVFQHFALFKHRTVRQNVAFGLELRGWKHDAIRRRVDELLELVQLQGFGQRYPSQLSGGQRQRVALARALAVQPRVLLLDEPFSALDAKVRKELRAWLRNLHDEMHVTTVIVTHDQEEAMEVADKIVVMNHGRIEQVGTPKEVYDQPANPFVYDFLGNVNLFRGRLNSGRVQIGSANFQAPDHPETLDAPALAFVRPHDIKLSRQASSEASMSATIVQLSALGPYVRVELRQEDGELLEVQLTQEEERQFLPRPGETVFVELRNLRVFASDYSI